MIRKDIKHFYYKIDLERIEVRCNRSYTDAMILSLLKRNGFKIAKIYAKLIALEGESESLNEIYYLGEKLKIVERVDPNLTYEKVEIKNGQLFVALKEPLSKASKERIRLQIYKKQAPTLFLDRIEYFANIMQLFPSKVSFRKAKRRWGSCSNRNSISLNIALVALPHQLSDYIIVHELAHIQYKNHSKAFWNLVAKYFPNYKEAKEELKKFATIL